MPTYSASLSDTTVAAYPGRPGPMTSDEFSTVGGIELAAGSLSTLKEELRAFRPPISEASKTRARSALVRLLDSSDSITKSYAKADGTGNVTIQFMPNGSDPNGQNWAPPNGEWFMHPIVRATNGDLYLAYDQAPSGQFDQLKAQVEFVISSDIPARS